MQKHKQDLLSILKTAGIIAFILIPKPKFLQKPVIALAIIYYSYTLTRNLLSKINYKKKKINAIRFSTANDEYYKLTNLIVGTLLVLSSVIALIYDFIGNWSLIGLGIGLLMVLNGYFFLPIGNFQFHEDSLVIETQDSRNNIFPVETIKGLAFKNQSIVLTKRNEEKQSFFNLNISEKQLSAISNYLNLQAPQIESTFSYSEF